MQRGLYSVLVMLALVPALVFGAGKIRGKVTDAGTGEPLVGANVVVVGTSMGAATNIAGEFIVLNVPAGTYSLRTSYVGYQIDHHLQHPREQRPDDGSEFPASGRRRDRGNGGDRG